MECGQGGGLTQPPPPPFAFQEERRMYLSCYNSPPSPACQSGGQAVAYSSYGNRASAAPLTTSLSYSLPLFFLLFFAQIVLNQPCCFIFYHPRIHHPQESAYPSIDIDIYIDLSIGVLFFYFDFSFLVSLSIQLPPPPGKKKPKGNGSRRLPPLRPADRSSLSR